MEGELIFSERDQSLLLHAAEFMGEGAAVDAEEGGQLLPGKGDGELPTVAATGLHGQVGEDSLPKPSSGEDGKAVILFHILIGDQAQEPLQNLLPQMPAHKGTEE